METGAPNPEDYITPTATSLTDAAKIGSFSAPSVLQNIQEKPSINVATDSLNTSDSIIAYKEGLMLTFKYIFSIILLILLVANNSAQMTSPSKLVERLSMSAKDRRKLVASKRLKSLPKVPILQDKEFSLSR